MSLSTACGIKMVKGDSMTISSVILNKRSVAEIVLRQGVILMPQGLFVGYNNLWVNDGLHIFR